MRLKPRNCPHFRRQIGCSTKQRASGQSRSKSPMICAWSAFQMRSRGVCWGLANHVFLGEGNEALRGFRASSPPQQTFSRPLAQCRAPPVFIDVPHIGPSLSALSCSVQAVIATPQASNCALNALNQACRPARRMTNCLPPRGTRCFSLRKTPRHLGLVLGDTHNRPEWKDLLPHGVQTGHHGAELCVSIYG